MKQQTDKKKKQSKPEKEVNKDYKDLYARALADYHNLQKQTARDKDNFAKYARVSVITEFLPVYENLKSAVAHANGDNSWLEGVKYVVKQFEDILQQNGVTTINPVDEQFNPVEHEAIEQVETDDEKKVHTVAKVLKEGYKMGERVLQAAKVSVYTGSKKND